MRKEFNEIDLDSKQSLPDLKSKDEQPVTESARTEEELKRYRKKISMTFLFLFIMNFIRVFDNGILPAMTTSMKEELDLKDLQVGTLGSLVYIGEVTGSLIAMPTYQKVAPKFVLLACIVLQSVVILGFAFSNGNFQVMAACRFFTGMFQVFISIYAPIWCDSHGPEDKKTTWITYIIVATPAGMVSGYLMTAIIISAGGQWAWSFFIQVILLLPIAIYLGCIDRNLLEVNATADANLDESSQLVD